MLCIYRFLIFYFENYMVVYKFRKKICKESLTNSSTLDVPIFAKDKYSGNIL